MTPAERSMKIFAQHGITNVICDSDLNGITTPVILVRADAVIDVPLVPLLIGEPGLLLIGDEMGHEKPIAVHTEAEHAASRGRGSGRRKRGAFRFTCGSRRGAPISSVPPIGRRCASARCPTP